MGTWENFNSTAKILLGAAVLVILVLVFMWWKEKAPVAQNPGDYKQPTKVSSEPVKDAPGKPTDYAGKLTVVTKDTVKPGDTVGTVHTITVEVLVPNYENVPPPVKVTGASYTATYAPIEEPWIDLQPNVEFGAGVSMPNLKPSPVLGVSFIRLFKDFYVGAAADRLAVGPFVGYEFWREFQIYGKWNALRYDGNDVASLGIAYRF